ncbi:MAG TPA: HEAT repeat domain-containing protein [Polyangiaceae bacterium]|nr:HEAT repeat domain-containing protein [Polyangiaceae bacterium]
MSHVAGGRTSQRRSARRQTSQRQTSKRRIVARLLAACVWLAPLVAGGFAWPSQPQRIARTLKQGTLEEKRLAMAELPALSPAQSRGVLGLAMADEDREIRLAAARHALASRLPDWNEAVVAWLGEPDAELVRAALELLALRPPTGSVAPLARALVARDIEVRLAALRALARAQPEAAVEASQALVPALDDVEPRVRAEAVEALGRVGTPSSALALALRLDDADVLVRRRAAVALGVLGDESTVSALIAATRDRDPSVVEAAATALAATESPVAQAALERLLETRPWSRVQDAALASRLASSRSQPTPALIRALGRPEARQRIWESWGPPADSPAVRQPGTAGDSWSEPLRRCLDQAAAEELRGCVGAWVRRGLPSSALFAVSRSGRLAEPALLDELAGGARPDDDAIVFALERLQVGDPAARASARQLLAQVEDWDPALREPLRAAVRAPGLAMSERAELLSLLAGDRTEATLELARSVSAGSSGGADASAEASALARAAAFVLVRARKSGAEAVQLLGDRRLAGVVAVELARDLDDATALALLEDYGSKSSSEREARRRALSGLSRDASAATVTALESAARGSRNSEAEELWGLLAGLERADAVLLRRVAEAGRGERRWLVSWAGWRTSPALARALAADADLDVRALAILALARFGERAPVVATVVATESRRLRWARLWADIRLATGGQGSGAAEGAADLDRRVTALLEQPDPTGRALAVVWLSRRTTPDSTRTLERVLAADEHPLVRRLAARALGSRGPSRALRACSAYEVDEDVARACRFTTTAPAQAARAAQTAQASRARPLVDQDGTVLTARPLALLVADGLDFAITSEHGSVVLPSVDTELLEPNLAF